MTNGDISTLGEIFKELKDKYEKEILRLEILCSEDPIFLKTNYINEHILANMDAMEVQEIIDEQNEQRASKIKKMAKEQGILEPKDQRAKMIAEFIAIKGCSESFAAKAYKEFIGD